MDFDPVADIKFNQLLRTVKKTDPLLPSDPVSIHILMVLLNIYRQLGRNGTAGADMLISRTNISSEECQVSCLIMRRNGLIESCGDNAYKLTSEGVGRAEGVVSLRNKIYGTESHEERGKNNSSPDVKQKISIWKKDISGYAIIGMAILYLVAILRGCA